MFTYVQTCQHYNHEGIVVWMQSDVLIVTKETSALSTDTLMKNYNQTNREKQQWKVRTYLLNYK